MEAKQITLNSEEALNLIHCLEHEAQRILRDKHITLNDFLWFDADNIFEKLGINE